MHTRWVVFVFVAACSSHGDGGGGGGIDAAITVSDRCVTELYDPTGAIDTTVTQYLDGSRITGTDSQRPSVAGSLAQWTYQYDADGRPILSHAVNSEATTDTTATYSATQVVVAGTASTYTFTLQGGRVIHSEGPMESPVDLRSIADYTYDATGRLATQQVQAPVIDDVASATMTRSWTYDALGRVTSDVQTVGTSSQTFTLTYATSADGWSVRRASPGVVTETGTFTFAAGRLVRSGLDEDDDGTDDWVATYAYDDAASAINVVDSRPTTSESPRKWQMRGCTALGVATAPSQVAPLVVPQTGLVVPIPGAITLSF